MQLLSSACGGRKISPRTLLFAGPLGEMSTFAVVPIIQYRLKSDRLHEPLLLMHRLNKANVNRKVKGVP